MNKKNLFTIIFLSSISLLMFYISGIYGLLEIIISIIIYNIISYLIYISWKKIRKKEKLKIKEYSKLFLYKLSLLSMIIIVIIGSFSYYQNKLNPAKMPTFTISNSKKTVVFQAMSHIGSKKFYNNVIQNIVKHKKDGFVLFFEGVKPGKKENMDNFDKALGVKLDPDIYKNFSTLYGVIHQDNSKLLGLVNNLDFNIDLNINEIMEIYDKKIAKKEKEDKKLKKSEKKKEKKEAIDINKEVIDTLAKLNPKQLSILRYINKSILNFVIKNDDFRDFIMNNLGNTSLFDVILDDRNKNLVKEIQKSKYDKIIITYGLMHFEGVFKLLKENDSNWKIIDTKYLYPIK